ncbi:MAG: CDP-diacylglycerol--glycerol-3-phosphate 3-phosphatidyltransferase [Anaerosomatales bacterium]|nr:CDP-diacylglycerol--glycerol-3-phosphate 3-phosphatidyltransferase [Anaerosomatales bacterium]MDT8433362.1 CDP-diacylglycerol--glycerol-3-phosphate 3-phosphatidyltransferase [Anaerosomatales bacterium]
MKLQMNWANRVTVARMVFIPVFVATLLGNMPDWGPVWAAGIFTLLAVTDGVDGYLARTRNEVTTFGKFLDPLADKLLVTAALVALVELGTLPSWIALVIISREFIVSGLRMVAIAEGKVIAASTYGKVKTVFQVLAIVAFIIKDSDPVARILGEQGASFVSSASWLLMTIAVALTVLSMIDYFYHARDVITGPWERAGGE